MGARQFTSQSFSDDVTLRVIVEAIESETGDRFFYSLVKQSGLGTRLRVRAGLRAPAGWFAVSNARRVGTRKLHGKF